MDFTFFLTDLLQQHLLKSYKTNICCCIITLNIAVVFFLQKNTGKCLMSTLRPLIDKVVSFLCKKKVSYMYTAIVYPDLFLCSMIEIVNKKIENIFSDSYFVLEEYERNSVTFLWWVYLISFERVDFHLQRKCLLWSTNAYDNRRFQMAKVTKTNILIRVLSLEILMWYSKALALSVQKLLARLKFSNKMGQTPRSRSQGEKIMVSTERSYQKEYSCEICELSKL